jgi:hypothetical protein
MTNTRIVSFGDLYSFRGDYDYGIVIYNTNTKELLHYSKIEGLNIESGDNYVDGRESFEHNVVTLGEGCEHLFPIRTSARFDLGTFNNVGSAHQKIKYVIPDDAPVEEIKSLLNGEERGWYEVKNGLGHKMGYLYPLLLIEVVPSHEFYAEGNPFNELPEPFQPILDYETSEAPRKAMSCDCGECFNCTCPF